MLCRVLKADGFHIQCTTMLALYQKVFQLAKAFLAVLEKPLLIDKDVRVDIRVNVEYSGQ